MAATSFIGQSPVALAAVNDKINLLLKRPDLLRLRISVAFARWDGLGLIATNLEAFLQAGGEFQCIYGVSNGITTLDSLLYSLYLQEVYGGHSYAGALEDEYANTLFHPKLYEFRFKAETIAVIGSSNLTGAGLMRNTELVVEHSAARPSAEEKQLEKFWVDAKKRAKPVTLALIRKLKKSANEGSEKSPAEMPPGYSKKPRLKAPHEANKKPLFHHILKLPKPPVRSKILAKMDALSQGPSKLYLQIFAKETGAAKAGTGKGYQIQLPVATLSAFFGVGPAETKAAKFHFAKHDLVEKLTHFHNNTHRVRLHPLREVERPAIVIFERSGPDEYVCSIVPKAQYAETLKTKCVEQTRKGARCWGIE